MAGLVQLELDADDKKSFAEMQQNMAQAEQELGMVSKKMMIREQERRLSELTLAELESVGEETATYRQVGKMFLLAPVGTLKEQLSEKIAACVRESAALKEKQGHVEDTFKKLQADFQEFLQAHMVGVPMGGAANSS